MRAGLEARHAVALLVMAVLGAGCQIGALDATLTAGAPTSTSTPDAVASVTNTTVVSTAAPTVATTATPPPTPAPTTTRAAVAATASVLATTTTMVASRRVHEQAYIPFAQVGGVTLRHPSNRVELIGFHESNLDGARQLESVATSAPWHVLEARERDTGARGAADIVVDPDSEIRAPVTGTVLYAGTYVLYCKYSDDFLVIEPDDHPGWEVKMLHIDGVRPRPGARVVAGQTVVAPRATRLPFESQVEKVAAMPAWPHVHIEVDDPTIPDRPTGGGC